MIVMTAIDSRNRFANTLKELAAKKTLEKITTEEIVKAAGVSRQTFYKFFSDKYDLAFWCYQRDMAPVIQEYTDVKISFHEMNVRMLEMLQQEKNFYRNVFAHYEVQNSFFRQYHRFSCDNTVSFFGRVDKKMRDETSFLFLSQKNNRLVVLNGKHLMKTELVNKCLFRLSFYIRSLFVTRYTRNHFRRATIWNSRL